MSVLACDIDPPNHFDFVLLYFKLLRFHAQALRGPISKPALTYILQGEYFASEYCKMVLADITLMSVRPSILAATAVTFGLECSFKYKEPAKKGKAGAPGDKVMNPEMLYEQEVQFLNLGWREIVD